MQVDGPSWSEYENRCLNMGNLNSLTGTDVFLWPCPTANPPNACFKLEEGKVDT